MQIQTIFIILAATCNLAAAVPYLIEVVSGKAKPRLVSWFGWFAIMSIGAVAAFSSHQIPAAVLLSVVAIESGLVALLGFKNGDKTLERFDLICLIGVVLGIVLWFVFRSSNLVITVTIATDFASFLPTFRHAWRKPHEETTATYVLFGLGSFLTLCVADVRVFAGVAYPLYDFIMETVTVFLIVSSPYRRQSKISTGQTAASATARLQPDTAGKTTGNGPGRFKIPYDGISPSSGFGLKRSAIPTPKLSALVLSRAKVQIGQTAKVEVEVNFPETADIDGAVYGQYCISSVNTEDGKWLEDMSWNGKKLSAILSTAIIPGTYQVNVRAKYELGEWSNVSSALLTVIKAGTPQS
ncbi:MAG TPA: hypothetical protein VLG47_02695 [Candidatus Saccharimonadales bacterium]|nr:hypothetical protein [Candidatus Saccharimonadales bacterium]